MKKSKIYGLFAIAVMGLVFAGCTDSIDKAVDDYNDDKNTNASSRTSGVIKYSDGTSMGTTRAEPQVNGGFSIYSIGSGAVVGFIRLDGQVNDVGGRNLGVCAGSTVSDSGLSGDCTVPSANPTQAVSTPQTTTPSSQPAATGCTSTSSTTPAGCEDRRDGMFDVTWNRPTCEQHGYFYCTLNNICTNQTVNINQCLGR